MKIAYAGDWHANDRWAVRAIEYAKDMGADHILHLGDYGYEFEFLFRDSVEQALARTGLNLWFVDGNHEDFNWLYNQPFTINGQRWISTHVSHLPRGYHWEWDGLRFLAMGGAYSVDRPWRVLNKSWWQQETITDEEVEKAIEGGEVDILISHDTPSGYTIPGLSPPGTWPALQILRANEHRVQLRRIVDVVKPSQIWHGHYHVRYDKLVDFGYGPIEVHGLDMDGTEFEGNILIEEF